MEAINGRLNYEMNQGPATPGMTASGREFQAKAQAAAPQGPAWVRLTVEKDPGNSRRRYYGLTITCRSGRLGLDGGACLGGHSPAVQLPQGHHGETASHHYDEEYPPTTEQ